MKESIIFIFEAFIRSITRVFILVFIPCYDPLEQTTEVASKPAIVAKGYTKIVFYCQSTVQQNLEYRMTLIIN